MLLRQHICARIHATNVCVGIRFDSHVTLDANLSSVRPTLPVHAQLWMATAHVYLGLFNRNDTEVKDATQRIFGELYTTAAFAAGLKEDGSFFQHDHGQTCNGSLVGPFGQLCVPSCPHACYCHSLMSSCTHAPMLSCPHAPMPPFLFLPCHHALMPSFYHALIPSCPHSYSCHFLMPSFPHAAVFSCPHAFMSISAMPCPPSLICLLLPSLI